MLAGLASLRRRQDSRRIQYSQTVHAPLSSSAAMAMLKSLSALVHQVPCRPVHVPSRRPTWRPDHRERAERPLVCSAEGAEAVAEPAERASQEEQQADDSQADTELGHPDMRNFLQRTQPSRMLNGQDVFDALTAGVHSRAETHYKAFYSSDLGGIITDPALMLVSIDDHMVHRGHAVFDTAEIHHGYVYCLDAHVQRFLNSAAKAGIPLACSEAQLFRIILETAAAGRCFYGDTPPQESFGSWSHQILVVSRAGGFSLSPRECIEPTLYVMVYTTDPAPPSIHTKGLRVLSSPVPAKDAFSATVKSTNYLLNALNVWDAEYSGCDQGIFVDENDFVLEGPNMNLGIITKEDELVVPEFDRTLAGITLMRILELAPTFMERKIISIKKLSQRPFKKWEAYEAKEVFMCGSSIKVRGVTQWDDVVIGDGRVGEATMNLHGLINEDMETGMNILTAVPYGFLTSSGDWVD